MILYKCDINGCQNIENITVDNVLNLSKLAGRFLFYEKFCEQPAKQICENCFAYIKTQYPEKFVVVDKDNVILKIEETEGESENEYEEYPGNDENIY